LTIGYQGTGGVFSDGGHQRRSFEGKMYHITNELFFMLLDLNG